MKARRKAVSSLTQAMPAAAMGVKARNRKNERKAKVRSRTIAGWREYVALPALGIGPLVAKLDTGARSAALHAENISIYQKDGHHRIKFDVPVDSSGQHVKTCDLVLSDQRRVKNTGGRSELRQVVETLKRTSARELPRVVASLLDRLDANGRWALLKFLGGALRVGVSARLAKVALAQGMGVSIVGLVKGSRTCSFNFAGIGRLFKMRKRFRAPAADSVL
jgi:hypothetical protein